MSGVVASRLQNPDSSLGAVSNTASLRLCAVSYLNTAPLVWGWLQEAPPEISLEMAVPSVCAERLRSGTADIGLVPVVEIARQGLASLSDVGIACDGPVRSILLFSRKPWKDVRTIAGDTSSRTSVLLAQILLRERYGNSVELRPHRPELSAMLANHDAALIIGDPALRTDPSSLPWHWMDLGDEWRQHTGLPMVFATWAGVPGLRQRVSPDLFHSSLTTGLANLEVIVEKEAAPRGIPADLALRYLRDHICYHLGEREHRGLQEFLRKAQTHGLLFSEPAMATRNDDSAMAITSFPNDTEECHTRPKDEGTEA